MFKFLPPATRAIVVANGLLFLCYFLVGAPLFNRLALWPVRSPLFEPWQMVTYSFMHDGPIQLGWNMINIVLFGRALERTWGARNYLIYYFSCVLAAAGTELLWLHVTNTFAYSFGASGGVFGILLAFAILFPHKNVTRFIPHVTVPAWFFVGLFGVLELMLGLLKPNTWAHFAHLGGMAGGAVVIAIWRTPRPAPRTE
jgi:membrane associated rhomboid family serine protease